MKLFGDKYSNSEIVSNYYGCPSLKLMIDDVLNRAKEDSSIGAAYEIFVASKTKVIGTIAEIAHLWGQPAKILRQICNDLKTHTKHLKPEDCKILLDEIIQSKITRSELIAGSKLIAAEKSLNLSKKRNGSPVKTNVKLKNEVNTNTNTNNNINININIHPLILFNCSVSGPAFGPIIF